jgi:hypothetical protein
VVFEDEVELEDVAEGVATGVEGIGVGVDGIGTEGAEGVETGEVTGGIMQ